jgi:DNA-directed RNA polymerase specialized sigma24 family protein
MRTPKTRPCREPRQAGRASVREQIPEAQAERDAGQAVTTLYMTHYRSLVRLAALLVSDLATAEDIVQDSFAAIHGTRHALPGTDAALCYLRRSVVRRSRSASRRQQAAGTRARQRPAGTSPPGLAGAGPEAGIPLPGSAVVSALRALPARQREVLVLRYFADLPEAEIASATGMSAAAVTTHIAQAMSSLSAELRAADG